MTTDSVIMESVSFNATPSEADKPMGTDASVRAVVLCVVQLNVQSYSPVGVNVRQPLPTNAWFREPTRDCPPSGISIGSAIFAGFTVVTNRHTHVHTQRPRYVNTSAAERCQLSQ